MEVICEVCRQVIHRPENAHDLHDTWCERDQGQGWCRCSGRVHQGCCPETACRPIPGQLGLEGVA